MPSSRVTVFGHGACRLPSPPAREPAAASISWSTFAIHAVTSASFVLPCSIAITTSARTHGRECRLPRRFRGSGRAAKQSRTLPPHASASAAACRSSARRAPRSRGAGGAGKPPPPPPPPPPRRRRALPQQRPPRPVGLRAQPLLLRPLPF